MERDDIGLRHRARIDALRGLYLGQRLDAVAQGGGALIRHRLGGRRHLGGEFFLNPGGAPRKIEPGVTHLRGIVLAADLAHAGRGATLDLVLQAGACAALEHGIRAVAQLKDALQLRKRPVDRAGAGKRAVIAALFAFRAAMFPDHRKIMRGDEDVGKALVVAQEHVVARLEVLDEVLLQQQRLGLGRCGQKHHRGGLMDHPGDARCVTGGTRIA